MNPLDVQKAVFARLTGTPAVTALVPVASILDRNARPAPSPSIILGEDQVLEGDDIARNQYRVISTLHIWEKALGLASIKDIAGAVAAAIKSSRLTIEGAHCGDCKIRDMRFLRDPDGEHAHGVVTIETLVGET
jgi:hypothetical protein